MNAWKLLNTLKLPLAALALFGTGLLCAPNEAFAQANQWDNPVDLKGLVPPVVPLPPNARLNPSSVGGSQSTNTTVPLLQNPNTSFSDPAPGLKLTIPTR